MSVRSYHNIYMVEEASVRAIVPNDLVVVAVVELILLGGSVVPLIAVVVVVFDWEAEVKLGVSSR